MARRARDRLEIDRGAIVLVIRDIRIDRCEPRELVQLFDVELPSDDPDLARFYLVEVPHAYWIIPYFTAGAAPAIQMLCAGRGPQSGLYRATLDVLPWRFRVRWLGIPIFPLPRLMRCDRGAMPRWTSLEGPLEALPNV